MKFLSKFYLAFIFVFLYAPILVMIIFSFNDSKSRSVWEGFSLKWYKDLMSDSAIIDALKTTLIVAIIASLCATVIGTLAAVGINAMKKKLKGFLMLATNIPMVNPEIVTGVSLMLLFVSIFGVFSAIGINLEFGMLTLILAHISFNIPYVILSVLPKLRQMNKHSYEAALDLGCNPLKAFFKVVMPEIMPGVMTGMLMAFTLSLDDFVISYCTSGTSAQTLSVVIYSMTRKSVNPKINALSALMFITVFLLMLIVNIRQMRDSDAKVGAKR
ncbi:MAG: ABC transporter permease [Clostridia bacterium]|nr:ABC transporter permease [Oscillospiraceae bacterium]MBR6694237.1 ABC transporter permease [Clostridia bacterium]